jgi:hypothetical protein
MNHIRFFRLNNFPERLLELLSNLAGFQAASFALTAAVAATLLLAKRRADKRRNETREEARGWSDNMPANFPK